MSILQTGFPVTGCPSPAFWSMRFAPYPRSAVSCLPCW